MRLHHVQLTLPAGGEDLARSFYADLLGLTEIAKPAELAGRGGVWFHTGETQLHFGTEEPGGESRRHIALECADLAGVRDVLENAGYPTEEAVPVEGMDRFYCRDPFGNKLEVLSRR